MPPIEYIEDPAPTTANWRIDTRGLCRSCEAVLSGLVLHHSRVYSLPEGGNNARNTPESDGAAEPLGIPIHGVRLISRMDYQGNGEYQVVVATWPVQPSANAICLQQKVSGRKEAFEVRDRLWEQAVEMLRARSEG